MRLLFVLVAFALVLPACGTSTPAAPTQTVTIDGRDSTGALVNPINVWASYEPRGKMVARVAHGESVQLVRRDGDGVLIRTADGTEGWITYRFIRELK